MSTDSVGRQLALGISPRDYSTLETFVAGGNSQAVAAVTAAAEGEGEPFIYLWGGAATGKSHLLQAACRRADELGGSALYIPLELLEQFQPSLFTDLERMQLVCLDDVHRLAGNAPWEEALFHLFNRLRAGGGTLLVAAEGSPALTPFRLPDLASRMSWGLTCHLASLDDADKQRLLQDGAARRGMEMSAETASYILRHAPRDIGSLIGLLDRLDRASLEAQRRLTLPFVREQIERLAEQEKG
jgi:DnaA family protein